MPQPTHVKLVSSAPDADKQDRLQRLLTEKPDGVLETIAREAGVATRTVIEALAPETRLFIVGERFEDVWNRLTQWGDVLFIVHTPSIVLECKGSLPAGSFGHGYYNIHGDSPIGGHIKAADCQAIYAIDRLFHGRRSCSVQFFDQSGEAMFKVFVRRDDKRELIASQLALFEDFKKAYRAGM